MLYVLDIYVSIQAFRMEQDKKKVEKNVVSYIVQE